MTTPDTDAYQFNLELRRLSLPSDCAGLFRRTIAPLGFDTFSCGELDLDNRERVVFYLIDWSDRWTNFYIKSGLVERDPLVDALEHRREPFTWSDLRADRTLPKLGRKALDLAAAEGWTEGLVVPAPRGDRRVGLVSMAGGAGVLGFEHKAFLTLASLCLHSHVRTLVAREGFAAPPAGLTPREIECVGLVAQGHSDGAIAAKLGIAVSTAHEFVEKAKRRVKAKSRTQMVAIAVSLGVIDI